MTLTDDDRLKLINAEISRPAPPGRPRKRVLLKCHGCCKRGLFVDISRLGFSCKYCKKTYPIEAIAARHAGGSIEEVLKLAPIYESFTEYRLLKL